ncbi:unnamed protein product [Lupinus luteus]|uniref:Uncharacterized protein n=1 Tax=Lupinus luteus TaxID=3873 RepID=A0AAV1WS87_LUPLU
MKVAKLVPKFENCRIGFTKNYVFDHLKSDFKSKQLVSKHITNNSLKDTIKPMLEEIPQNRDGIQRNLAKDGSWKNQEKSKLLMELLSADHGALSWRRAWQGQTKTWPSQSLAGQNQAAEAGRPADMFDR